VRDTTYVAGNVGLCAPIGCRQHCNGHELCLETAASKLVVYPERTVPGIALTEHSHHEIVTPAAKIAMWTPRSTIDSDDTERSYCGALLRIMRSQPYNPCV
jgi:hypothetical protein